MTENVSADWLREDLGDCLHLTSILNAGLAWRGLCVLLQSAIAFCFSV